MKRVTITFEIDIESVNEEALSILLYQRGFQAAFKNALLEEIRRMSIVTKAECDTSRALKVSIE